MVRRELRAKPALALFALLLAGCGGPSNQDIFRSVVASIPLIFLTLLGALTLLERLRGLPDEPSGSILRPGLGAAAGLAVLSAGVLAVAGKPDPGLAVLGWLACGSVGLFLALVVWRARRKPAYASRVLVPAAVGIFPALPAFFLWPQSMDGAAGGYSGTMILLAGFFAVWVAPLLFVGLAIEAHLSRKKEAQI
jgi:hypothetical protein